MNKNIRVGSVFSGVGAPEYALKELGFNLDILFACDNGEIEINDDINLLKEQTKDMSNEEKNEFIKAIYRRTNKVNYVKKSYFANYNIDEKRWYEDIRFLSGVPYKNNPCDPKTLSSGPSYPSHRRALQKSGRPRRASPE